MNLDNLRDTIQNISLYDVKAAVRKAQNVVMNYTEMEAKVREATNNEPWGASSTLMQEIASGTYNYQLLNEIMPMIYKRFTEKSAEEWRQIYKALQLLEYLVKHGSEQVIDDGRSHLSTIKMLRQFHFIDMNGKDQGINVRNRAKELAELLSDVDRIRQERKKARASKNKYGGVEGGGGAYGGMGGSSSGMGGDNGFGRRYGGFGSESSEFGGYSGGVYGDGGGFGGRTGGFHDEGSSRPSSRTQKFEEYDEYDDGATATRRSGASSSTRRKEPAAAPAKPPKKKEPEVDLFSFGDEPTPTVSSSKQKQTASVLDDDFGTLQSGGADDDDFDDFQSASGAAPSAPATFQAPPTAAPKTFSPLPPLTASASSTKLMQPTPMSAGQAMGINDLVGIASISPAPARGMASPPAMTPASTGGGLAGMGGMGSMSSVSGMGGMGGMGGMAAMKPVSTAPTGYQPTQPNYFTSMSTTTISSGTPLSPASTGASATAAKKSTNDAFGNIWSMASKDIKKPSTPVNNSNSPSLQSLAKEKASAGIWGAPAASGTSRASSAYGGSTAGKTGGGLDDLLG
ncbi:ENTH-domain-containing protein [Morchella conica CCBAS932]|uniref:ENTH-domain-containing protein n=1 Tax=Morchella conica CCBAS932 TaxID=1392247 RepID=A0A3N4L4J0_9PEZI|nr:ENTH-domain-containing protein [Morchella conica CCBAS932]